MRDQAEVISRMITSIILPDTYAVERLEPEQWRELAAGFSDYNFTHTWNYGIEAARRLNASCEQVAIKQGSEVLGLAAVRVRSVPLIKRGIAYVAGGPLVRKEDRDDAVRLEACLRALQREYGDRRGHVLRILASTGSGNWSAQANEVFEAVGFRSTTRSRKYRTLVLDISRDPEEIRKGFRSRWRTYLNAAIRSDLSIRWGTSAEIFEEFGDLYELFVSRKGFVDKLSPQFFAQVQKGLIEEERSTISLVEKDGKVIAGQVSSVLGDTCVYLLGATGPEALECRASYLLHWENVLMARERGTRFYDLGGIDPEGNPGVYQFKKGMGGVDLEAPGPFEYFTGGGFRVALLAEGVYRRLRGDVGP